MNSIGPRAPTPAASRSARWRCTPPHGADAARRRAWLTHCAAWSACALPARLDTTSAARDPERASAWIRAVAPHRAAALAGKPTGPGGPLLGPEMAIERAWDFSALLN